ncbi:MAG: ABC transporter ATP-binding protein [Burkholderiaceae bacterium]|jgi:branched-chain amino acid transport system ATP-binding protein|nr:ABC transporter ATP-binding protein [Burkholderiaceae bacterium]
MNITNLNAFYDKSHILHGVNLSIGTGEIVALLGRNGSGRSTLAKAIMGLVHATGQVQWRGVNVLGHAPFQMAQAGVAYVPESRDIFPKLTVAQNLLLGQQTQHKQPRWSFEDMYNLFPRLRERANTEAGVLSGGEQQMLTLCRSLMGDPELIIIDEPTEGLAPMVVEQVAGYLKMLKSKGVSVLLIEQKLTIAMDISDRVAVMGHGRIAFEGTPAELRTRADVRQEWLEVNG